MTFEPKPLPFNANAPTVTPYSRDIVSNNTQSIAVAFLDRDGTIIEDTHYPRDPDKVRLIPGATEGLKILSEKGYVLFVISNQAGVAKDIISPRQFAEVHCRTAELLESHAIQIADYAYCFEKDNAHPNRKPNPGMIPKEISNRSINLKASLVIGDRETDVQVADRIGSKGFLVLTGKGETSLKWLKENHQEDKYTVCKDLLEVAKAAPHAPG